MIALADQPPRRQPGQWLRLSRHHHGAMLELDSRVSFHLPMDP